MIQATKAPPSIPDYELLRPIGRGSYGEVWLARSVTGVFRVIKVVRRDRFEDDRPYQRELEGISRFQATASGRPRQLALLHVGRNDVEGYFYYVMEPADDAEHGSAIDPDRYVPLTLRELFLRRGRLAATECVQLALELARGLSVLHESNLIHRDIKPSNIIFVQQVPKLADVGLVASSDATMTCAGTPGYAPPEGAGTVAADLFSLGKVLYEISTGLDRTEFPRLPSEIAEDVEAPLLREINAIVLRSCNPDPRERHPSAEAFARDLEIIQAGRSVAFYETLRRRLRAIAVVAAAIAVLAATGAGLFLWRARVLTNANDQTRRALYRSDLAVAQLARSSGDLGRARAALQRQIPAPGEPDLRGLEWSLLAHAVRGEGAPLEPTTNGVAIRQLAVDPTGRWVAAGLADDTGAIWDLRTGRIVRTLAEVQVLGGFTHAGELIVDEPNRILRVESPTNGLLQRYPTGKRLNQLLNDGSPVLMSPTGDLNIEIIARDQNSRKREYNITKNYPPFSTASFAISPDGKHLALALVRVEGAQRSRMVAAVDLDTGRESWRKSIPERLVWLVPSPDNVRFVVNRGGLTPTIYSYSGRLESLPLIGHLARVNDAAFSTKGTYLATASADQTVKIWNVATGSLISTHHALGRPANAVQWLPDDRQLVVADDTGNLQVFQFPLSEPPEIASGYFNDVHGDLVFSPDGKGIAISKTTDTISLLNSSTLSLVNTYSNVFQPLAFTPDGASIWCIGSDLSLRRVQLQSGQVDVLGSFVDSKFRMLAFAVSPDSRWLALAGDDGRVFLAQIGSGNYTLKNDPEGKGISAVTFTADSTELWTGNSRGSVYRWSTTDAKLLGMETKVPEDGDPQSIALSPNGRWLAASSFTHSAIRIWDRFNRTWLPVSLRQRRFVQTLEFTRFGDRMISGGADGRVIFWSVPQFEEVTALELEQQTQSVGDEGIASLHLSRQGDALAALTEDGRVRIWRSR